jgi:hypothetical protein
MPTTFQVTEVILGIFFGWWFVCFSGGFCEKWVIECGFLMVNLWWMCGELWCFDGHFLAFEKHTTVCDFIFWVFPFWECV